MPVTAKLSKKFYDVLGEDVANELVEWFNQVDATYRTDLRELNELNFQRFDAKLEQRIAEFSARFDTKFAEQSARFETKLAEQSARFDAKFAELREFLERRIGDQTRWLYAAWAVQVTATVAILLRLFLS